MVFYKPEFYLIPASKRHLFENKMNSRNDTNPRFLSVKEQSKSFSKCIKMHLDYNVQKISVDFNNWM